MPYKTQEQKTAHMRRYRARKRDEYNAYMREYNSKRKKEDSDFIEKQREYSRKKYLKKRQNYFTVYYLPEEHYVGMTNCLKRRLSAHKSQGKIIDGWEVVANFKRAVDAHLFETRLHCMGYEGFFVGNFKILEYND